MIKPLLQKYRITTGTEGFRNGRACFLGLQDYHHGKQQKNVKRFAAQDALKPIHWTNAVSFTAENDVMKLLDYFNVIDEYGKPWGEDEKNRHLHLTLYRKSDTLPAVLWIEVFKNELLEKIDTWRFQVGHRKV